MKKILYTLLLLCIFLMSCQEESGLLFSDKARVSMTSDPGGTFGDYSYSFVWSGDRVERDTVFFPIHVMGGPADVDRTISIEQVSEFDISYSKDRWGNVIDSTVTERSDKAVPNKHYVAFDNDAYKALLTIPAGKVASQIGIILLRDASLKESKVRLRIRLKPNSDFLLGDAKYLERTIAFSDKLEKPSNWDRYLMDRVLGTYSTVKHELMIAVVKEATNDKVDEQWIESVAKSASELYYWRMLFIEVLQEFNKNPVNIDKGLAPLRENPKDKSSKLIEFPSRV